LISDQCVFIKKNEETGQQSIVLLYVDDIIITGDDELTSKQTIEYLASQFKKIKVTDEVSRYIGIDIIRDKSTRKLTLIQQQYLEDYLDTLPVTPKLKNIPLSTSLNYHLKGNNDINPIYKDVGKFRYASDHTRPDTLYSAGLLGSAASNPHPNHIAGLKHFQGYLQNTKGRGLVLGGDTKINLFGFSDAACLPGGESQLAYCFYLGTDSGTICARTTKDKTISHHSTEAEIKALDAAVCCVIWLKEFLQELGFPQGRVPIYVDSEPALILANTYKVGHRSNHLLVRLNFIHQEIEKGNIQLIWINSEGNVADMLTKPLSEPLFSKHEKTLMEGFSNMPIEAKRSVRAKSSATLSEVRLNQKVENRRVI